MRAVHTWRPLVRHPRRELPSSDWVRVDPGGGATRLKGAAWRRSFPTSIRPGVRTGGKDAARRSDAGRVFESPPTAGSFILGT